MIKYTSVPAESVSTPAVTKDDLIGAVKVNQNPKPLNKFPRNTDNMLCRNLQPPRPFGSFHVMEEAENEECHFDEAAPWQRRASLICN